MVCYIIGETVFCFPTSEQTNDESERNKRKKRRVKRRSKREIKRTSVEKDCLFDKV